MMGQKGENVRRKNAHFCEKSKSMYFVSLLHSDSNGAMMQGIFFNQILAQCIIESIK